MTNYALLFCPERQERFIEAHLNFFRDVQARIDKRKLKEKEMIDSKVRMMATEQQVKRSERIATRIERLVRPGDLLRGARIIGCKGVKAWFDFPRYRVVGMHMDNRHFFVEALNSSQEVIAYSIHDYDSDQWQLWKDSSRRI